MAHTGTEPPTRRRRSPGRPGVLGALLLVLAIGAVLPGSAAGAPSVASVAAGPSVASVAAGPSVAAVAAGPSPSGRTADAPNTPGGRWTATAVPGGTRLTLRLDRPLPARAAAPGLAVDGVPVAGARSSSGDRVLTVVTANPAARRPRSVEVTWAGAVPAAPAGIEQRRGLRAAAAPDALVGSTRTGAPVATDPAAHGRYRVQRLDYDLGDTAVRLAGLGGRRVEMRAAVYAPAAAPGRRPVIVFLHGRHSACYSPAYRYTDNSQWPCPRGLRPLPSYLGYGDPATALASDGYVVVSISADGINALDNEFAPDLGAQARGELVMAHLDLLARADAGRVGGLGVRARGRLDLTRVGLMGHSRGGEGVVRAAALNAARRTPHGIRGLLPLAPVDFTRAAVPGIPTAVVLPYCDGDVSDLQGQHLFEDSRYADPGDDVLRASLLVQGANHNFFNSEWTPGSSVADSQDDWFLSDDPVCGVDSGNRLTPIQQRAVGTAYLAGFFRLTVGGERSMLPLFDGSAGRARSAGNAVVWTQAQAPRRDRVDLASLEARPADYLLSGTMTAARCASLAYPDQPAPDPPLGVARPCVRSAYPEKWPSFTPAALAPDVPATPVVDLRWSATGARAVLDAPAGRRDVRRMDALTVRLSPDDQVPDEAEGRRSGGDLSLGVVDGAGRSVDVAVDLLSAAQRPFPGTDPVLGKRLFRTVRLPVARLRGLNLSDVRQVRLTARSRSGGVFVSDVAFSRSGLGSATVAARPARRLPSVGLAGAALTHSGGRSLLRVTVRLSAVSRQPVRVAVQVLPAFQLPLAPTARTVTLNAGTTRVTVEFPLAGSPGEPDFYGDGEVVLADQRNSVIGTQVEPIRRALSP